MAVGNVHKPPRITTAITAAGLAAELDIPLPIAERLCAVAYEVVAEYAPGAPQPLVDESIVRFAGYLASSAGSGFGAMRKTEVGPPQCRIHGEPQRRI